MTDCHGYWIPCCHLRAAAAAARAASGGWAAAPGCCRAPGASARLAPVRVYIGSDHAGFALKAAIIEFLAGAGHEPVDCGPPVLNEGDD